MIALSRVSEVQNVAVVLQFAQNQVRAVHGYAIIGIQCVAGDDADQISVLSNWVFLCLLVILERFVPSSGLLRESGKLNWTTNLSRYRS